MTIYKVFKPVELEFVILEGYQDTAMGSVRALRLEEITDTIS